MSKRRCCRSRVGQILSVPSYVYQVLNSEEATVQIQFRESYNIELGGQVRHYGATNQVRFPYSLVFELLRIRNAPIFIVRTIEKEQFYAAYGLTL